VIVKGAFAGGCGSRLGDRRIIAKARGTDKHHAVDKRRR
jgi:hypothetical protein